MRIEKHYFDVVSDGGAGFIAYTARVSCCGLTGSLGMSLRWPSDVNFRPIQARTVWATRPHGAAGALTWQGRALRFDGSWRTRNLPVPPATTLWHADSSRVAWQVLAAPANTVVRAGNDTIAGLGYAETLTLDLAPWRLPIDTLRWGRFLTETDAVIWISWQQASERRWLWHNGNLIADVVITDDAVSWPGHRLQFGARRTLRSGRLGETAFKHWPLVQRLVPARLRAFDETKWCAPATLAAEGIERPGWTIYELVRFR